MMQSYLEHIRRQQADRQRAVNHFRDLFLVRQLTSTSYVDSLKNEAAFAKLTTEPMTDAEAQVVAGLALAIKTPAAGSFLIKHLSKVPTNDRARLVEIVKAAASQASANNVGEIVNVARTRFEDDRNLQIELLNSVKQGQIGRAHV